jgi:hypothetical protein
MRTRNEQAKAVAPMGRILKALLFLIFLGFLGLTGFAYFGNLTPEQKEVVQPVTLDAN